MTVAPPTSYPGSRVLARWWRELESLRPRCFWAGYVGLHRLEGPVRVVSPVSIGRMEALLLGFLQFATPAGISPPWERLSLNPAFLFRMLNGLAGKGLVTRAGQQTWTLTPQGVQALTLGNYDETDADRRAVPFLSAPAGEAC